LAFHVRLSSNLVRPTIKFFCIYSRLFLLALSTSCDCDTVIYQAVVLIYLCISIIFRNKFEIFAYLDLTVSELCLFCSFLCGFFSKQDPLCLLQPFPNFHPLGFHLYSSFLACVILICCFSCVLGFPLACFTFCHLSFLE
jgi:hypothetical protein